MIARLYLSVPGSSVSEPACTVPLAVPQCLSLIRIQPLLMLHLCLTRPNNVLWERSVLFLCLSFYVGLSLVRRRAVWVTGLFMCAVRWVFFCCWIEFFCAHDIKLVSLLMFFYSWLLMFWHSDASSQLVVQSVKTTLSQAAITGFFCYLHAVHYCYPASVA